MKKSTLLILSITLLLINGYAQTCLPEGKTFAFQPSIDNFSTDYPGCEKIEGDVIIYGENIINLYGLEVLTGVGQSIEIQSCSELTSLSGLDNLESVGLSLKVYRNPNLTDITALAKVDTVPEDLYIETNDQLTSLEGLHNVSHVGGFLDVLVQHRIKELSGLRSLETVGEYLYLSKMDSIQDLTGLESLRECNGLAVGRVPMFKNFSGITSIEKPGNIAVIRAESLESLEGLENVDTLNSLRTSNAEMLENFNSLESLKYIEDFLEIGDCDNLLTLGGLESVSHIKRIIISDNQEFLSLRGIDNIDPNSITQLILKSNPKLSLCAVESICDYIALPDIVTDINSNAPKCTSVAAIDTSCLYMSIGELTFDDLYNIYPNPVSNKLHLEKYNGARIEELKLYNQYGQIVRFEKSNVDIIDVDNLTPGLYVLELQYINHKLRSKLIIK